ncbi:MAG: DNA alkylation repair protein [Gemmatimonadaceae bacterium]
MPTFSVSPSRTLEQVRRRLKALADPDTAAHLQRFFKTGPGEYGDVDRFLGIRVPVLRALARECASLPLAEVRKLLRSEVHEERLLALLVLVRAYAGADVETRNRIYTLYLESTRFINNWDLVDLSAEYIVGPHLSHRSRRPLETLARSPLLWERRIAMLATFHYIKQRDFETPLRIAELLLRDPHDLIHKAVGWMLREIGKRDERVEEEFLRAHCRDMPRTMLRYAIERFPEPKRRRYLDGTV